MNQNVPIGPRAHSALPRWVWDLLIDLQRQEDEHPPLFVESADGYRRAYWCPKVALDLVPVEIAAQASAIGSYLRESVKSVDLSAVRDAAPDEIPDVEEKLAHLPRGSIPAADRREETSEAIYGYWQQTGELPEGMVPRDVVFAAARRAIAHELEVSGWQSPWSADEREQRVNDLATVAAVSTLRAYARVPWSKVSGASPREMAGQIEERYTRWRGMGIPVRRPGGGGA